MTRSAPKFIDLKHNHRGLDSDTNLTQLDWWKITRMYAESSKPNVILRFYPKIKEKLNIVEVLF